MIPNSIPSASPAKLAAAAAALAALALALIFTAAAPASSGGLGTSTSSGGDTTSGTKSGSHDRSEPSPLNRTKPKYRRMWKKTTRRNKRWARRTSECESGRDPDAIGGGGTYRGAFQFMRRTWRASPKSPGGDPTAWNYKTQAVVAVALKKRDGAGHWPVCG